MCDEGAGLCYVWAFAGATFLALRFQGVEQSL